MRPYVRGNLSALQNGCAALHRFSGGRYSRFNGNRDLVCPAHARLCREVGSADLERIVGRAKGPRSGGCRSAAWVVAGWIGRRGAAGVFSEDRFATAANGAVVSADSADGLLPW